MTTLRAPDRPATAVALWLAVLGLLGAARLAAAWSTPAEGPPRSGPAPRGVIFDTEASRPGLSPHSPLVSRDALPSWLGFNSFFIDTARSGLWPRTGVMASAIMGDEPIVSILPERMLTARESAALDGFLGRGGRLLVIDSIMSPGSAADSIAARYGLRSRRVTDGKEGRDAIHDTVPRLELLADGGGRSTLAGGIDVVWRQVGRGRILLAGDGALLGDRSLGGVYAIPDALQRRRHEAQRQLMEIFMADADPGAAP